jgi:hypothetical protein
VRHPYEAAPLRQSAVHEHARLQQPVSVKIETDISCGQPLEHAVQELARRARGRGNQGPKVCGHPTLPRERVTCWKPVLRLDDERSTETVSDECVEKT